MNLRKSNLESIMVVLFERGRSIPSIPDSLRDRMLSRARASMATAELAPVRVRETPVARHHGVAIAIAAAVACAVGAAGAAVALRYRAQRQPPATPALTTHAEQVSCPPAIAPPPESLASPQPSAAPKAQRTERAFNAQESYAAELALLQGAQAAYADRNFATALLLVADHTRRFPNGRLAEEREALRVKALIGAGRDEEARRATTSFTERFPRSALLRRLGREPSGGN
jgi:hypothetical protein